MHQEEVGVFILGLVCLTISVSVSRPMTNDNSQQPWSLEEDLVCPDKTYPYWIDELQMVGCYNFTMNCKPHSRAPASKVTETQDDETSPSKDSWSFKKDIYIIRITISVLGIILTTLAFTTEKSCLAAIRTAICKKWYIVWNGLAICHKIQEMIERKLKKLGDTDKERLCDGVIQLVKNAVIGRTNAGKKDGKELCQVLCGKVPDAAKKIEDCSEKSFAEWRDRFDVDKTSSKPKAHQMIEKLLHVIYASDKRRRFYFPSLEKEIENYLEDFIPSRDQSREDQDPKGTLRAPPAVGPAIIPGPSTSTSQPEADQSFIVRDSLEVPAQTEAPTTPATDEEGGAQEFSNPMQRIDPGDHIAIPKQVVTR